MYLQALDVLQQLHENGHGGTVPTGWEESQRLLPSVARTFLSPARFLESRVWSGLPEDTDAVLLKTAERIVASPALLALAWHGFWTAFESPEPVSLASWPRLEHMLGRDAGVFYLLIGLEMIPRMRTNQESVGFPERVARETALQIQCYCETYQRANAGKPGLHPRQLGWLRHYTREPYVRVGRLEYWLRPNPNTPVMFCHRDTGHTIALAEANTRFTPAGYIDVRSDRDDSDQDWTATFETTEDSVIGFPISPSGMALQQRITLPKSEWENVLKKGDPVLQMHIPAGGKMTPEATKDSVQRAFQLFDETFPDQPPSAIVCGSWIFGNQLQEIFASSANLVRFQRELYLHPVGSTPQSGLWFIFLEDSVNPMTSPRDTSLRRGVLDHIAAGGEWRVGGMIFLARHAGMFGTQLYRTNWPPPQFPQLANL
ncbi:MAG: DUF5596 domain-containing protein [Lentisphaerae bacterium]|jgi:hypothetical protein|nr:DUF5596 domain-containing protein [Lentisphaerota bacterium]MBT5610033.1 DUF5596 domain-containing protein [Lentisphaerota bacterium]MBT7055567.1 DUF5596 domain-containing protein [Lentisphaerota bacterium]MBT7841478.1 DUF5596 domain-containing protein [Lentisphaerota bacterium]